MTAIITDKYRFANMREARRRIDDGDDLYYIGIGRSEAWPNDSLPPQPDVDFEDDISARHALQSIKKVADIAYVAPRYNWRNGDTYVGYDDADADLHAKRYFVINQSNFNVYICLKAGPGSSTVEPVGVDDGGSGLEADRGSVAPTAGADGYIWKYLYTISAVDAAKFLTNDFLPIFRDLNVAANAIQGAIYNVVVETLGAGYASAPTVTIEGDGTGATATATVVGGEVTAINMTAYGSGYTYARVILSGGSPSTPAKGRPVVSPSATGREIESIDVISGGTSYPNGSLSLTITGDGYNATATATVTGGVIQPNPTIDTPGYNYTEASVEPVSTTAGDAAEMVVEFSAPSGGFGYDPVMELNGYYIMYNIFITGDENPAAGFNGDFIPANNYRQMIILKNPLGIGTPQKAFTDTTGIALESHIVTAGGTWVLDDVITGATSGAKAIIDYYDASTETLFYHQNQTTGFKNFTDGETLNGAGISSGSISAVASSANKPGEIDKYSGTVLYLENRVAVSRAADQTEDIKLVIEY